MDQYKKHLTIGGGVLLVFVFGWIVLGSGKASPVAEKIDLVCAETGKTFRMRTADLNMFPAVNPSTGKRTLLPYVNQNGQKFVVSRYVSLIEDMDITSTYVDKGSHVILTQSQSFP